MVLLLYILLKLGIPNGFLLCEGGEISRTTYSNLFNVIGTLYGKGDNSTTFNLPDFRGVFVRGAVGNNYSYGQRSPENMGIIQDESVDNLWGNIPEVTRSIHNGFPAGWEAARSI